MMEAKPRSGGMDLNVSPEEYSELSNYLSTACGIELGDNKQYLVNSRLRSVVSKHGFNSIGDLLLSIKNDGKAVLRQQLIDAMTTHETLWFRDQYPYEALKRMILPELARAHLPNICIWSAACSSGQEPYSISMIIEEYRREYPKHPLPDVQVVATDISPTILKSAREGIYDDIVMASCGFLISYIIIRHGRIFHSSHRNRSLVITHRLQGKQQGEQSMVLGEHGARAMVSVFSFSSLIRLRRKT